MCLTLTNATTIIDHHPSHRAAARGYTRTLHPAAELTPGDLWRPDPDRDPHTVTEVHHTRDRKGPHHWITLVDQYAQPYSYRSDELVPTAIPDPLTISLTGKKASR